MNRVLLVCIFGTAGALAEPVVPVAFERPRYAETFKDSPFALASVLPAPIQPPAKSVLDELVLAGLGTLEDGREFVVVRKSGEPVSLRFEGKAPGPLGFAVKQVNWANKWDGSSVVMTDGSTDKTIKFDAAAPVIGGKPPKGPGTIDRKVPPKKKPVVIPGR